MWTPEEGEKQQEAAAMLVATATATPVAVAIGTAEGDAIQAVEDSSNTATHT